MVDLAARAHAPAGSLSHGEKRRLELAIALAQAPKLLLLDEPMAGAGAEETRRLIEMLKGLKRRYTIVLVEHDMQAVFALADRISVLVEGRMIATGTPQSVRDESSRARRLSRRGGMSTSKPLLAISGLQAGYGRIAGAVRRRPHRRRGRGCQPDGPQRHGQDHHRAQP